MSYSRPQGGVEIYLKVVLLVQKMEINTKSAIVEHIASVAEWSIATGCKPVGHSPTKVRILPGAHR